MHIDDKTIEKLERLSMLEVKDTETLKKKLEEVLSFMENLGTNNEPDVEEEKEMTIYHEDNSEIEDKMDNMIVDTKNNKLEDRYFKTPKVL